MRCLCTRLKARFSHDTINTDQLFPAVPVMKVMDGFGRTLADQFYKAGSSLEVEYSSNTMHCTNLIVITNQNAEMPSLPCIEANVYSGCL